MSKKRGAQPGNINALKHGFYSRFFNVGEITDLETIAPDLTAEIALLRVVNRRLFDRLSSMESSSEINLGDYTALTALLSSTALRLSSLMRANQYITGNSTDLGQALIDALQDTIQELDIK